MSESNEVNEANELVLQDSFKIVESIANYEKKPIDQIIEEAKELDIEQMAIEVISWAITNVEQYVESDTTSYQINLVLDAEDDADGDLEMTEIRKLQALYRAIPGDTDSLTPEQAQGLIDGTLDLADVTHSSALNHVIKCRTALGDITQKIHDQMRDLDEYMLTLYKRLVYYYEMVALKDGEPVLRELEGAVDITTFDYDAFPVAVRVRSPIVEVISENEENEEEITRKGETMIREYIIPEGFILFIELAFRDIHKSTSMF